LDELIDFQNSPIKNNERRKSKNFREEGSRQIEANRHLNSVWKGKYLKKNF